MHILTNTAPISINYGQTLPPGEWLVQDDHAFLWGMMAARGTVAVSYWDQSRINPAWMELDDSTNLDGSITKSILLIRSGAIGDLLLLSPCIAALRAKYPGADITLCCFEKHASVVQDFGVYQGFYPVSVATLVAFDLIIPLENIIELATDQGIHATDAFAEVLGVTVTDYKPVYRVTEQVAPRSGKPRVGLQLHASSAIRGYPMPQWNAVMQGLLNRGWEIMLLGQADGIKGAPPEVHDCSTLSFREAAAVLATCDVFCGIDSSFFNLCPSLGVPAIGLFGPVDWRTRIKEGSGQHALTAGGCDMAPCGWTNSRGGRQFPEKGPCSAQRQCVPLANIPPERIVAKIDAYRK